MLKVNCAEWGQTPEDLRRLSLESAHPRTRERFLALYEITQGSYPTKIAKHAKRHFQSVIAWVHQYNNKGPDAVEFLHTGGHPPFAKKLKTL